MGDLRERQIFSGGSIWKAPDEDKRRAICGFASVSLSAIVTWFLIGTGIAIFTFVKTLMPTILGLNQFIAGPESVAITFSAVMNGSGEGITNHPDVGIPLDLLLFIAVAIRSHQTRIVGSFLAESGSLFGRGWR